MLGHNIPLCPLHSPGFYYTTYFFLHFLNSILENAYDLKHVGVLAVTWRFRRAEKREFKQKLSHVYQSQK